MSRKQRILSTKKLFLIKSVYEKYNRLKLNLNILI